MSDLSLLVQMGFGALLALSVYLPLRCGQLSLATPGFYVIGGYVAALLSTRWPALTGDGGGYPLTSLALELLLAALVAAAVALLLGRPVLQLRGIYLAIATIALVEILRVLNLNLDWSGGAVGIFGIPQPFAGPGGYALATGILLALVCWLCARLEAMRLGRAMAAIRDDELAARCMGIPTADVKLTAFVLSAVIAALTGVLAAHFLNTWNARQGSFDASVTTLAFVVFGGSRIWLGPVLGGLVITALPELLRPVGDLRLILFGLVILVGPILFPQGLVTPERFARLRDALRRP
ncbi:branched-chain amino acid ABC transporter permease [Synechococcus sp. CBW1107]|uniref:branched-chain amino acid ABC transporter permease n=1 Tax=Synechococcus sp. CBW1107 TaxID=2789857 RepID=UPI001E31ED84|nr:branched-chain amino acid ABC transporter permease [Synechococcus sp. CBW1107]